ncbi:hypothetical protein AVEN_93350-1 [Araneus ventricosus]|uniref:Uncharacterized protein n=1 Tax=Araneus ventricosus TaxID=182803 RepID=A0A4Y2ED36_ARAVE|nr:hypothetical protein AVEN_93350-1 [Araneus ventricosus]
MQNFRGKYFERQCFIGTKITQRFGFMKSTRLEAKLLKNCYLAWSSSISRYKFGLQASTCQCRRRCSLHSFGLANRNPLSKFFMRGESHMEQDQRNELVMEVPKCNVSAGNLTTEGTCEPVHYRVGAPTTCNFETWSDDEDDT